MGLAAPKRRKQLSRNPNNTTWATAEDNYGRRILTSQGWTPGSYLGATDAAHSEHYTPASSSHIPVSWREENLGLGANFGGNGREATFGLSVLSGIFGRLNGKSDVQLETEKNELRDAELRSYQSQKHGFMNFVSGGLLVGSEVVVSEVVLEEPSPSSAEIATSTRVAPISTQMRKSECDGFDRNKVHRPNSTKRKRKNTQKEAADPAASHAGNRRSTNSKCRSGSRITSSNADIVHDHVHRSAKASYESATNSGQQPESCLKSSNSQHLLSTETVPIGTASDDRARGKAEKRARKQERRKRKEDKRRMKDGQFSGDPSEVPSGSHLQEAHMRAPTVTGSEQSANFCAESSLTGVSIPTSVFAGARHAVRHRYIQSKRLSSIDPQALKEILMVKTAA